MILMHVHIHLFDGIFSSLSRHMYIVHVCLKCDFAVVPVVAVAH